MKAPHLPGLPALETKQGENPLPMKAGKGWEKLGKAGTGREQCWELHHPDVTGIPHTGTPQVLTSLLFPGLPTQVVFGDLPLLFQP